MVVVTTVRSPGGGVPDARRGGGHRSLTRIRGLSLYARVVLVNVAILLIALMLLILTPVTVSASISARQIIVLVVTFAVMVAVDAALVRFSFRRLVALVHRMDTLDVLRPRERLPELGGAEARALIGGFNTMLDRLEAERRASTQRSVTVLESERQRISRELHDEIGQRLTGILLQLGRIRDDPPDRARAGVAQVLDATRAVMDEIGALAWQMRPGTLDDLGLLNALETLAASFGAGETARVKTVLPHQLPLMTSEEELAIYRIAQEALTNAVRHSGATAITVAIQVSRASIALQVSDNGCGLPETGDEGMGLRGMRERALLVGGQLGMHENHPHGLRVDLTVPTSQFAD